jgi:hypothetical protein
MRSDHTVDLFVIIEVEEGAEAPSAGMVGQSIWEALPKEMKDAYEDSWGVTDIRWSQNTAINQIRDLERANMQQAQVIADYVKTNNDQGATIARLRTIRDRNKGWMDFAANQLKEIRIVLGENTDAEEDIEQIVADADSASHYLREVMDGARRLKGEST